MRSLERCSSRCAVDSNSDLNLIGRPPVNVLRVVLAQQSSGFLFIRSSGFVLMYQLIEYRTSPVFGWLLYLLNLHGHLTNCKLFPSGAKL